MAWYYYAAAAAAAAAAYKAYKWWTSRAGGNNSQKTSSACAQAVQHTAQNYANFDPTTVTPFDPDEPSHPCGQCKRSPGNQRDCLVLPCAHRVMCQRCAADRDTCPFCGTPIEQRIRVIDA